ncbi:primase, variant [Capsaspora owczarzaki ATCC 30864]|nr:primase, variant [Capsaspora owczarzaki ATCC 30864]|eukprot:XP_011270829.1 primase, variant [Capsaspora owczarzaki ATCC 30864]
MPLSENDQGEDICVAERRKDHISHYILRLVYCRSEDLRRWFLMHELELFRFKFVAETQAQIVTFLKANDLSYVPIPNEEKAQLLPLLQASAGPTVSPQDILSEDYFKLPFLAALELVRSRRVYLQGGAVYVPRRELVSILSGVYRSRLSSALAQTSRALPNLEEDERLVPLLNALAKQYLGSDYLSQRGQVTGNITSEQVDGLSTTSFSPCMRNLHQALRGNHHLRHGGRMQYGLFLKSIGLHLDEAMRFWRTEFTRIMGADKFDKSYAYNIRHNYGKEGKRTDYSSYSCAKIITSNNPGVGDHHGCPFRHFDAEHLRQKMYEYGVASGGIKEIIGLVQGNQFQVACTRYFELTHKLPQGASPMIVSHPRQFYDESRKLLGGNDEQQQQHRSQLLTMREKREQFLAARGLPTSGSPGAHMSISYDDNFDEIGDISMDAATTEVLAAAEAAADFDDADDMDFD